MKLFDWVPPLVHMGQALERIAGALEVIVRESYGINLSHDAPDLSLEISYTDLEPEEEEAKDAQNPNRLPRRPGESIGEEDEDEDENENDPDLRD